MLDVVEGGIELARVARCEAVGEVANRPRRVEVAKTTARRTRVGIVVSNLRSLLRQGRKRGKQEARNLLGGDELFR